MYFVRLIVLGAVMGLALSLLLGFLGCDGGGGGLLCPPRVTEAVGVATNER